MSRRVIEWSQGNYRTAALDAAVERKARQDAGGDEPSSSGGPPAMAPSQSRGRRDTGREAHEESVTDASTGRGPVIRADALHRLGIDIARDENFGWQMSRNTRRALAGVSYLNDAEKHHVVHGIDNGAWAKLAEASEKFRIAGGKRGAAGLPSGPVTSSGLSTGGRGGGGEGRGELGSPSGPSISLGNGVTVHLPGGARGAGSEGDEDQGFEEGRDFGFGHGNAGDPKSPTGGRLGRGGGRGSGPLSGDPLGYGNVGWHGGLDGGISGGRLPSRATLAGAAWKALNPAGMVTDPDEPSPPPSPSPPPPRPDPAPKTPPPRSEGEEWGAKVGIVGGALLGAVEGGVWGAAIGAVGGAIVGHVLGGAYERWRTKHNPADDPLGTGAGGGWGGPRAAGFISSERGAWRVSDYMPAPDDTGPGSPRSLASRASALSKFGRLYVPNPDDTGPRGPWSSLYLPNPDTGDPGNPHSRGE